ncbi:MAG: cyanophycin synthetase [Gammaproteobacteria bacterium]|nr:cyanophycin synthetase [Gammaproteobacteria bacterium]MBU1645089.1 cyanophycin synthetase [Gammaproteobacteria bacterium]MBU1973326.1 cyanophycin synthetase [Gammaproteobacteria bacterium]
MSKRDLAFLRVNYLRGPNIWTYRPVIEAWVDIGDFEQLPSNLLPGFTDRLVAMLPGLDVHRCGVGEPGGFILRLREGTWLAHVLEHVTIELQNLAGSRVGFGKARQTAEGSGIYKVAVRARDEQVGRAAIAAARELILAAVDDLSFDLAATVAELRELVDRHCLGPSTACIVDAAIERKIPWIRLSEGNLVQLGYGNRQRRIWTAETDSTSAIAEGIASDKDLTKTLLAACGVPVPEGSIVTDPAHAWETAEDIGLPVAVKPVDGNHGRGISLELGTREEVEAAFPLAAQQGSEVMVERHIPGNEHRLLIVGGKMVAAARGESAWVTGDGRLTIRELIERDINSDPRRGPTEDHPLGWVNVDDDPPVAAELARQGFTPESVPPTGLRVLIQRNGNVANDCTGQVCPEVAEIAGLAARVIGLDVAGVDLVAEDISRPLEAQGGAIVEVNAGPGLLMHLKPASGAPQPVGEAIASQLFAAGESGRIPVVGISGSRGTAQIARLTAWIAHLGGRHVGLACADGLFINRRCIGNRDPLGFDGAQSVLMNRTVDTVVIQSGARGILNDGLPYDRCLVGVVTDIDGASELGEFHLSTDDQLRNVLRTQVDVVLADGVAVLNAADGRVVELAELCDGGVIFYGADDTSPVIAKHRAGGGRAVFAREHHLVLAAGADETLLPCQTSPHSPAGQPVPESLQAAAAAAWALGIAPDLIGTGIETYEGSTAAAAVTA